MDGNLISLHFRIDNNLFRGGEASPSVTTYYYPLTGQKKKKKKMVHVIWWIVAKDDLLNWKFAWPHTKKFGCHGSRFQSWRQIITDSSHTILTNLISWVFRSRLWDDGLSSCEWIITGTCGCVWVYSKSPDPFPHEITRSDWMNTRSSKDDFYISLIWTIFLAFTYHQPTPPYRSSFQNGRHVTELIHRKRAWPDHPFLSKCITIIQ